MTCAPVPPPPLPYTHPIIVATPRAPKSYQFVQVIKNIATARRPTLLLHFCFKKKAHDHVEKREAQKKKRREEEEEERGRKAGRRREKKKKKKKKRRKKRRKKKEKKRRKRRESQQPDNNREGAKRRVGLKKRD